MDVCSNFHRSKYFKKEIIQVRNFVYFQHTKDLFYSKSKLITVLYSSKSNNDAKPHMHIIHHINQEGLTNGIYIYIYHDCFKANVKIYA